jgi:hypothetical protein
VLISLLSVMLAFLSVGQAITPAFAAGPATKLAFSVSPSASTPAGSIFAQQPVVQIQDATSAVVTTDNTTSVRLDITSGTGTAGAILTCTANPIVAVNGVATFSNCRIDRAGNGYTLTASSTPVLTSAASATFNITPGPTSRTAFIQQPCNSSGITQETCTGGVGWTTQPQVAVTDAQGATQTSDNATKVTLSITPATPAAGGPGVLTCPLAPGNTLTVIGGVADFSGKGCNIDKVGTGYKLRAVTSPPFTPSDSNAFNITFGPATQLIFPQSPSDSPVNTVFATQPQAAVGDAGGNVVTSDNATTIKLDNPVANVGAGGFGAITCTQTSGSVTQMVVVSGVAAFTGCKIDLPGNGYKLHATSTPSFTPGDSALFNIYSTANKLSFSQSPSTSSPGVAFPRQPVVQIQDIYSSVVAGDNTTTVTLSIASGTPASGGPGSLTCDQAGNTTTAVAGVATFTGCKISATGADYRLTATSSPALSPGQSDPFSISGPATKLAFAQQPNDSTAGVAFPFDGTTLRGQPIVQVQDASGNPVRGDNGTSVTLSIVSGTGTPGATLTCNANPVATVSGNATFAGCKIDKASPPPNPYQLFATSSPALTGVASFTLNIIPGPASKLAFSTQPGNGTTSTLLSPQPVVQVQDANGNVVVTDTSSVTLAITPGTGTSGATLAGCADSSPPQNGVHRFSGCRITTVGTNYQLTATNSNGSVTAAISAPFNIAGAATKLVYVNQPSSWQANAPFPSQPVLQLQDASNAVVTYDSTTTVRLDITGGTGTAGAVLTCNSNPVIANSGVATFGGCKIDRAGTGYTLTATAIPVVTPAVSNAFNITAGPVSSFATSNLQYSLANSDGATWQEIDPLRLRLTIVPGTSSTALLTGNADLWTANAGYNQDLGIFVSVNGGADQLVSWKESGGFAGTFSPNAAFVQGTFTMNPGNSYVVKLKWKTNKNAPGVTIFAAAGLGPVFSPTRLSSILITANNLPNAVSTSQYTLANSDGATWQELDAALRVTVNPSAAGTAVLGGNADLWTTIAGYNQDIGVFVSVNAGADQLVAWKESGGSAGTFSPNAAFVQGTFVLAGGSNYVFKLKWKTNKNAPGVTILAAAGLGPQFSATRLTAILLPAGLNPYSAVSNAQYSQANSDGASWKDIDSLNLRVTVGPVGASTTAIVGANADLWTANAGFNQDIGIFVSVDGGADQLISWKESGGNAGTFSPNAAFAEVTYSLNAGSTYVFKLKWKTNKSASGVTIFAAAGLAPNFSPTSLIVQLTS